MAAFARLVHFHGLGCYGVRFTVPFTCVFVGCLTARMANRHPKLRQPANSCRFSHPAFALRSEGRRCRAATPVRKSLRRATVPHYYRDGGGLASQCRKTDPQDDAARRTSALITRTPQPPPRATDGWAGPAGTRARTCRTLYTRWASRDRRRCGRSRSTNPGSSHQRHAWY